MLLEEYFPQKLALSGNFCNRVMEQQHLEGNIRGVRPTLIISPRRYGKTSLGMFVIEKLKIPYAHLDLFPLANSLDVQNVILNGVSEILISLESTPKKALKLVTGFFSELNIRFKFVGNKVEVDLAQAEKNWSKTILSALKKLESVLEKKKKKAVLFLDEFQRLNQMQDSMVIEGALRHIAQKSQYIIFLFSGSNRHLLSNMFDDSTRPLYKLCDRIVLERINRENYIPFIAQIARHTFKKNLAEETIETILNVTECHPYYVNVLCSRLWRKNKIFESSDVIETWHHYAVEEKSTVFKELEALSANQLRLLIELAKYDSTKEPLGDEFLSFVGMPISSVRQSFNVLLEKDYVYKNLEKQYRILDPLIKYILSVRPE